MIFKVKIKLKQSQLVNPYDSWKVTYNGDVRTSFTQDVEWFSESLEDAIKSFNIDEVEHFTIEGPFTMYHANKGIQEEEDRRG